MDKSIKTMTYKDFKAYCNRRACDGLWDMQEAVNCIAIMSEIDAIKVKVLGFTRKKRTSQAQEDAWVKLKSR